MRTVTNLLATALLLLAPACVLEEESATLDEEETAVDNEITFNPDPEIDDELAPGENLMEPSIEELLAKQTIHEGLDYASIDASNNWVEACDMEQDGNGVYAQFRSPSSTVTVSDGNGSQGGCGNAFVSSSTNQFRVCEDDFGSDTCSPWTPVQR